MCGCRISVPSLRVCVVCLNEWVRDAMRVTWRCRGSRDWTRSRIRDRLAVAPMHEPCVSHLGAASGRPTGGHHAYPKWRKTAHDVGGECQCVRTCKTCFGCFSKCVPRRRPSHVPGTPAQRAAWRARSLRAPVGLSRLRWTLLLGSLVPRRAVSALPPSPPLPALF